MQAIIVLCVVALGCVFSLGSARPETRGRLIDAVDANTLDIFPPGYTQDKAMRDIDSPAISLKQGDEGDDDDNETDDYLRQILYGKGWRPRRRLGRKRVPDSMAKTPGHHDNDINDDADYMMMN